MSWRLLLGDLGQDWAISDAETRIKELQKESQAKGATDRRQDSTLTELQERVFELEQGLSALMKLLHAKNLLSPADLEQFARFMAEAERQATADKSN
jgi:hypothetical protein